MATIRTIAKQMDTRVAMIIHEAWMVFPNGKDEGIISSLHADRIEVIMIAATIGYQDKFVIHEMIRDADGQIVDLKERRLPEGLDMKNEFLDGIIPLPESITLN